MAPNDSNQHPEAETRTAGASDPPQRMVAWVSEGHEAFLEAVQKRHGLTFSHTFRMNHALCGDATLPSGERVFVKIKGYQRTKRNKARLVRATNSNQAAARIGDDIYPHLIELQALDRDNGFWLISVNAHGGSPVSGEFFFDGDESTIDQDVMGRIQHAVERIARTPSPTMFYEPAHAGRWIVDDFGRDATHRAAEWTSAHCDLHWANILNGGRCIIDWDMFAIAPKGFDAASIMLWSSHKPRLFERMYAAFAGIFANPSAHMAVYFAATRILRIMRTEKHTRLQVHEQRVRDAVATLVGTRDVS